MLTYLFFIATAIYQFKGKYRAVFRWIYWFLTYVYFRLVKQKPLFDFNARSKDLGELGIKSLPKASIVENPRQLDSNIHASDSIRVWGSNKNGVFLFLQIARRHNRISEVQLYFYLAEDEIYQLPIHPETCVYNTDGRTFTASGLNFEVLEPLRRWRIYFNGQLRNIKTQQLLNISFNFLWIPTSCYVSFPEDFKPHYMADFTTTNIPLCPARLMKMLSINESVENGGQLHGKVTLNDNTRQILIRGFKVRSHGNINWKNEKLKMVIEIFLHDGSAVKIFLENLGTDNSHFVYGYVLPACNVVVLHIKRFSETPETIIKLASKTKFEIAFTAGDFQYNLIIINQKPSFKSFIGDEWAAESNLSFCDAKLNDIDGKAILQLIRRNNNRCPFPLRHSVPLLQNSNLQALYSKRCVVAFNDAECCSSQLVGGKAASLALMTSIHELKKKCAVPSGVCVTKNAWNIHLRHNPSIEDSINNLIILSRKHGDEAKAKLQQHCDLMAKLIFSTSVSTRLRDDIERTMKLVLGNTVFEEKFAIRSSAIGEDGEEISAAGQNESYLGIKGLDEIASNLLKCWASQFSYRSVEYKRQNAQLLNEGMGVVIQKMVKAEAAGVLFSKHPLTKSSTEMVITANYGLGESVVSAITDPDTIIIQRNYDDQVFVKDIKIGRKEFLIQMIEDDKGGTEKINTNLKEASKCCLDEGTAITLAQIAVILEKYFGSGRDIEWAVYQNHVYILQSRPVTTDDALTDFEILHEFDTPMRTDHEAYTIGNLSEVLPGCQTTLSLTSIFRGQIPYFQLRTMWRIDCYKYDPIVVEWMASFYGHAMFDLITQKAWSASVEKDQMAKAFDVGLFGRVLDEEDIMKTAIERFKIRPPFSKKMGLLTAFTLKGMIWGKQMLRSSTKRYQDYRIPLVGAETMAEVYEKIEQHIMDIVNINDTHLGVTYASTLWNMFILNILAKDKDYNNDIYSDFATLIGSCNGAESGDIPNSFRKLTIAIQQSKYHPNFATEEPTVALNNLQNSPDAKVKQLFSDFIKRHGHRGMKESDLISKMWGREPKQIITVLQGMANFNVLITEKTVNVNIINTLKTPLTPFKKRILRWILKFCQQGICYREASKSLFMKYVDGFREAYGHLSKLLVDEGLLIDAELIYFFTHEELGKFIRTRSPSLLRRAKQRWKMFDYKDKLQFPEVMRGLPKPINDDERNYSAAQTNTEIKGVPVSHGIIEGQARVVTTFHDVHTIKPGDILITHATDIGWSPYFPMLNGIVTEIGGLISHGAVIAREFGLPCIVGVDHATKLFQSGDIVLLNATKGTIMKIK